MAGGEPHWEAALALDPGVTLHLYGKRTPAPGRKMGHLTVLDPDPETALDRALAARHAPGCWPSRPLKFVDRRSRRLGSHGATSCILLSPDGSGS